MSVWLDSSGNSNKFKQSYFRDFVDVSGEVLIRNGLSLKLYNSNVPTRVQFSINSNEFRVYNDANQTYYDISNTKLMYLQDLSENIQAKLNQVNALQSALSLKANASDVDASLNLKSNITYVDASLNAKPSFSQVDSSLNLKSAVTYVDASLNLKSSLTYVDASLNAKPSFSQVDASLNLKSAVTYVDASLNAKPSFSQVDASLNLKSAITYVDASLNAKPSFSQVDASLNLKSAITYVDASLNAKPSFSQVDSSLNLKANLASPTFTGTPNAPTASYDNSSNQIATTGFVQGRISSIINSAPAALDTLNELAAALGNDANFAATVTNSLSQKANTTDVNTALALKATISSVDASFNLKSNVTYVDASLNAKPSFSQVDVSLNAKPSFSQVDASLNLKSAVTYVDASLNLKSAVTYVDASLNAKPSFSQVDASLNAKPSFSQVDASLNLKSAVTYVDASLNLKAAVAYVDASLNAKPSFSQVDVSLNTKPSFSQVDASLNLKASSASPTFTGTLTAPKLISGDASFNGNIDISGVLSVTQTVNSVVKNTTINNYNVSVTNDLSLNGKLIVSSDVSLNSKLYVKSDASFNGRVDVCGNFYAQYPNNSIPSSAINNGVTLSYVDSSLNAKPSFSQVDASLNLKSSVTYVDASLNLKPSFSQVDASLNAKPSFAQVDASLNLKPSFSQVDSSLNLKPSFSQVDASLNLKSAVTYVDASLNLKPSFSQVDVSLNLKPSFAHVDASLNLKSAVTYVDASLNLKPSFSQIDASLNLKPSFSQVDASLNLKTSFSQVDASLNLKSSVTYVDSSLNLKPSFSQVDTSLNLKSSVTYVDASLNLKPSFSQVDASLNMKPNFSQVDASLNLKPSFSQVDVSLNLKSSVTYVDASLNLKANLASPTFTGTPNAPTASYDNSSNQIATTGFVQGRISSIINSAPAALDTLNELAAALGNDANFAATVTNSLSQKANTTDVNSALALKPSFAQVDASLNMKPSFSQIDASLNLKPSFSQVDASLNLKPTFAQVDASLNAIVNMSQVDASLNLKPSFSQVDASLNLKPSFSHVDASLNLKSSVTYVDASLNLKSSVTYVDASLNLKANVASPTFTGNIAVSGDVSFNSKLFVSNTITISGDIIPQTASQSNLGSVDKPFKALFVSNSTIHLIGTDPITGNKTVTGISVENGKMKITNPSGTEQQVNVTLNNKTGFGKDSSEANATLDISGTAIISGDVYLNSKLYVDGNVDISGVLSVTQTVNSVVKNTTINNYNVAVTNDLSLNGKLIVSSDVSLNSKLYVKGDASFNGRVDICGNFYAQYPASSIPSSAIIGISTTIQSAIDLKATKTIVDASFTSVNSAIALKATQSIVDASFTSVNSAIALKATKTIVDASFTSVNSAIDLKATKTIVDASFTSVNSAIDLKATKTIVDASFTSVNSAIALKADLANPTFTGTVTASKVVISSDASFNGRVDICGNFYANYPANSIPSSAIIGGVSSGSSGSVDISSNQTIYGVKTFTNGLNVGPILVSSVTGNPSFQRIQIGQDIDGEAASDQSGYFVSMNSDGTVVAIGAPFNDGTANMAGHVRVYKNINGTWTKLGQDIDGEADSDQSGWSVSLSSDGTIVAIAANRNVGVGGIRAGHVRVYKYNGSTTWTKLGQDIDGEATNDGWSGYSVSLSSDGTIVAIGSPYNSGSFAQSGSVRVYKYNGSTTWTKLGQDIDGEASGDQSGYSVSISSDGTIVAIGAPYNTSSASGEGQARVYKYNGSTTWTQIGQDIDGEATSGTSGYSISLSSDGTVVAIGAIDNDGTSGSNSDNRGSVRVYKYNGSTWTKLGQDLDGEASSNQSGRSVSISGDGTIIAIGAPFNTAGTNSGAGHVRIYQYSGTTWTQLGTDIDGEAAYDSSGMAVSLSTDGVFVAIGATDNDANGTSSGHVRVYKIRDLTTTKVIVSNNLDICGNLYAQYAAASIPASAINGISTAIQTAIDLKATKTIVDASFTSVNSAIALKATQSIVDASFTSVNSAIALKANLASPTFTGNVVASKMRVTSDASFNGRVDICGNFYAQYPASSIPSSAIIGGVGGGGSTFATDICVNSITIGRGGGNSNFSNAVGINALGRNTTGGMNVAVGTNSLFSNLTGENNVAMNFGALYANTSGSDNIAIGKQTLTSSQTGGNNIGIGTLVLQGITSSSNNTAVGHRALVYSSTGNSNTAYGYLAGQNNSTGSFNTYIGYGADLPAFGATWSNSTAIGANAMITASNQIVLGTAAERVFMPGKLTTSGDASFNGRVDISGSFYVNSLTVGRGSGNNSSNTALGVNALFAQGVDVNSNSTAIGYYALSANQAGNAVNNSAVGFEALKNNTTGNFNTALGSAALRNNTTGGSNTALGASSLTANTTGGNNVGINGGLSANTTGSDNVAIGKQALTASQTGGNNIGIGTLVLQGITSSSNNTAIGHRALVYSSTGSSNTAYGYLAGGNNSTGSFNTYIGYGADVPAFGATWSNSTAIGANAMITASNQITLGTAAERVFIPGKLSTSGDASFNGRLDIGTNSVTPFATLAVAQLGTNLLGRSTAMLVGTSTALNDAGTIVAVGCPADGNFIGSVRIYQWSGTAWTQLGQDIVGTADNTQLGNAVSLSSSGFTIAIGGFQRNLVRVYQYASNVWTQVGADIVGTGGAGSSVSISADGLTVAIGAPNAYINGGQDTGQTRVYKYISSAWTQLGQDLIGEAASNRSGFSLALSADGTIVVIGAHYNDGTNPNGTIRYMSGHARIYKYANSTWTQLGQDIDGEVSYDMSGWSVAISDDGTIVAIGAPRNTTGATTYNGHARIYKYANNTWTQLGQDIDGRAIWAQSGSKISLSADGYTVAIGSESANGLGGEASRGYAVVYTYNGSTWSMVGSYIEGQAAQDQFGYSISLSADGTILSVGAPYNNSSTGYVKVYKVQTPSSKIIVSDGIDICGNLYAKTLQLSSSATFNGRVDICGNFYAQYPPNSIPASAIIGGVGSSSGSSGSSTGANVTFTDNFALIKEAVVVDPASILLRQF